ncbi:MAG: flagellar basal body rod protein FlgC [Solirubrobacteraceae bacterium]|nr:flagellar basal body rod protein FlgC [Solirubrobacteraceae bacterium]
MSLFNAMQISATGMSAERTRMDVASENLANANSTNGPNGAYRRKEVALRAAGGNASFAQTLSNAASAAARAGGGSPSSIGTTIGGVQVAAIVEDKMPNRRVYDPGHPDANAEGYVEMPNVNPVLEMTDLISASRAYEANVTAMQTTKAMLQKTLEMLR